MSIISISAAVGQNAPNRPADVVKVQTMLNHFIVNKKLQGIPMLVVDGDYGPKTQKAINVLQVQNGLISDEHFYGWISPGGMTITFMNEHAGYIPPPEPWECYTKTKKQYAGYNKWAMISDAEDKWLAETPMHEREVGIFKSKWRDGTRPLFHLAWKTTNPGKFCSLYHVDAIHTSCSLHTWLERETSPNSIRRSHNIEYTGMAALAKSLGVVDAGVHGIAAMNAGMNLYTFHYVVEQGMCLRGGYFRADRNLRLEAKAIFEIVHAVVAGASGAKSPPKVSTISFKDARGWLEQVEKIVKGDYPTSSNVDFKTRAVAYHKDIRDAGGNVVGKVKYFD